MNDVKAGGWQKRELKDAAIGRADVDEVVRSGSALDEFAKERGQSLYLPLKPLHMLPVAVMDAASFNTTYPTEAITVMLECDTRKKAIRNWEVFASIVPPVHRVNYDQYDMALEHGAKAAHLDEQAFDDLKHIALVAPLLAEKLDNRRSSKRHRELQKTDVESNKSLGAFEEGPIAAVKLMRRSDRSGGTNNIQRLQTMTMMRTHSSTDG